MLSQVQLISKLLKTGDYSVISSNNLTADYFFNYKAEFTFIQNHYDTYRVVPDTLTFLDKFPTFDYVDVREPESYLLTKLFDDYKASYMATQFNKMKALLEDGKIDQATEVFTRAAEGIHKQGAVVSYIDLIHDTSRFDRYLELASNRTDYYITTGFRELDTLIGGIDRENENFVIAARTGIGKTWTLLKMATAAVMQGKNVGMFSGEMSFFKVGSRVDSLLSGISNSAINRGDLFVRKEYEKYIKGLATSGYGSFKVITPQSIQGPATVSALRAFVERENLDMLFIDQYSLLEDTSRAKASHERVANISKDIKNLQVISGIPIISVCQMNRTKNEDGSQDTTQIGLSDRIGQDATVILMLDRKDDKLILNVVKSRDGGDNKKLTYKADFNTGTFTYIPEGNDNVTTEEEYEAIESSYSVINNNDGGYF